MMLGSRPVLALLPRIYNKHINVLDAGPELTPELEKSGYVVKPMWGKSGGNIKIVDGDGKVIQDNLDKSENAKIIYQEFCKLPKVEDKYVQISTWMIEGNFAGSVLRASEIPAIHSKSPLHCLRIIPGPIE
jgi:glutathionylspermidine amidase/synthetase